MRANFRTAITVPERSWVRFRDVISEFALKQQQQHGQAPPQSADVVCGVVSGVGGSSGDAGSGDKEPSLVVESAATTSSAAAAASATAEADNSN